MKPLNPVMAVLVAAFVGALPLRAFAADGAKPAASAAAEDINPVNALAKILAESPTARADAGKRIEEFLLDADSGGKSFVAGDVDSAALGAVARAWGESTETPGKVAVLYFVAGPGLAAPGWALADPVLSKTFNPGMKWEGRLRAALADWTGRSQIDRTKEKGQVTAFLNDAAAKAATVFSDARARHEIDLSVGQNDNTAPSVPDTRGGGAGPRLDGPARPYTLDDLYRGGAMVTNVFGPKDPHSRTISMKIYTKRLENGTMVNEIGIFDITDTNDIFGQRFAIDSGNQSFILDDRTPGHKKYELSFGPADAKGNRSITFARPGGGQAIKTSVSELFVKRADQAAAMGNIVTVGDQEFYALPQGGAKSVLAFFPKGLIDAGAKDPRDLVPALYAEVGRRGVGGRNENIPSGPAGGPQLGKVGDKDYHLVFNPAIGLWEVQEGAGDPPEKPAAKPTKGASGDASPEDAAPEGGVSVADLEALLLKSPDCTKDPNDTKSIAADLKGKYGLITCDQKHILLLPMSAGITDQQKELKYGQKLYKARIVDHFLVLVFAKHVQYMDLLKQSTDANGNTDFAVSGMVDLAQKNASEFSSPIAFADALEHYMGVNAGTLTETELRKRAVQALGRKPYTLEGGSKGGELTVRAVSEDEVRYPLWPTVLKPDAEAASSGGPAKVADGVSSADEPFPSEIALPGSRLARVLRAQADVALYESVDVLPEKPEPKKYFLQVKGYELSPADPAQPDGPKEKKMFRQKEFELSMLPVPLPEGFDLQGLTTSPVVRDRMAMVYRRISGTTTESKGVLAAFQNKQLSGEGQKDKADNCIGPVLWWGLSRDEALEACQDDALSD